jgi:hypothetical protein
MNRRSTPITARGALPAASAAKAAGRPSSAAAALPMVFRGQWTPTGRAFEMTGPLTLSARTLRWSVCGKAARRIKPVTDSGQLAAYPAFNPDGPQDENDMPQALIDLTADGAPPCHLDTQLVTHLRLKLGDIMNPGDVCEMQMTLYGYGPHGPQVQQELGWAGFTNGRFIPDKGIFLPCPAAQKAQAAASSAASSATKAAGQ